MITNAQGTVANDHIAFRSLRLDTGGEVNLGIKLFEPILDILGYKPQDEYFFPNHLYARHYRHPQQEEYDLPKLFISELIVEQLPPDIATSIYDTVVGANLEHFTFFEPSVNSTEIFKRPWQPPLRSIVEKVNSFSQYGAWVLLHGYAVNHFTGYVNRQNTLEYPNIEATANGLTNLGVPMKAQIEGSVSVGLRQTATQAVTELVTVVDETEQEVLIPWTYAYYEIAERYMVEVEGERILFDGFLGNNAKQLFEMTKFH
jgi:hypothetical protein